MDLRQLEYFVGVADAGSFSRAAVALNLAQPTLSRQIGLLEKELGQRLLVRTGRGASTTEAGDALLVHARALLDTARRAREELRHDREPRRPCSRGAAAAGAGPPRGARGVVFALKTGMAAGKTLRRIPRLPGN